MLRDRRILFYVPEGNLSTNGVYASQVGGLAKYCESLGAKTLIWDNALKGHRWFYQTIGRMRLAARENAQLVSFGPTHIYARTYSSCLAAKELAKKTGAKLIYSMRGADVAEELMAKNFRGYVIAADAAWCVRRAIKAADHINAVSQTMAKWIERKFRKTASVLPCCVAGGIKADGWPKECDEKTIVYSGGLSAWQKIDTIIRLMKRISEADASIRFRFLTKDLEALKEKCESIGLDAGRWAAKSCMPSEVAAELMKADCGIILRDNTLVNQVASPIKIGEYLSAGLGLIASPFIGDVGKDLADMDFACLIDESAPVEKVVSFVKSMNHEKRRQAVQWVENHLAYESNKDVVFGMFYMMDNA